MKVVLLGGLLWALFIVLDIIWFSFAGNFFKAEIGSIARLTTEGEWNVLYSAGAFVYVLMTIAVLFFVLPQAQTVAQALFLGALLGFVSYGIYDFTNLATLSAWTLRFAAVDVLWGTFLCSVVATAGYYIATATTFFKGVV